MPAVFLRRAFFVLRGKGRHGRGIDIMRAGGRKGQGGCGGACAGAGDVRQSGRILAGPGAAPLRLRLRRIHLPLQGRHLKPPLERLPCKGSWRQGRLRGALPLCIRGIFQNQAESCPASPRDAACTVPRGLGDANPAGGNKRRSLALHCRVAVHACRKGLRRKNAAVLHKRQLPDPFIRGLRPAVRAQTSPPPSTGSPTPRTPACQRPAPGRR